MNAERPAEAQAESPASVSRMAGGWFFAILAAAAFSSAAMTAWRPSAAAPAVSSALAAAMVLFAVWCLYAMQASARPDFAIEASARRGAALAIGSIGLCGTGSAGGLSGVSLAFCALVICCAGAVAGLRTAVALGSFASAGIAVIGAFAPSGARGAGEPPLAVLMFLQWLVVWCGVVGGGVVARVRDQLVVGLAAHEQRFRGALRIAADRYGDQDANFRFADVTSAETGRSSASHASELGHVPWDLPEIRFTPAQLDAHRADLAVRRPFHGALTHRRDAEGRMRTISVGGEPKFGEEGVFTGSWGGSRDVTDEALARRAITASETRDRELFTRSPSPLFLHRHGLLFDATTRPRGSSAFRMPRR